MCDYAITVENAKDVHIAIVARLKKEDDGWHFKATTTDFLEVLESAFGHLGLTFKLQSGVLMDSTHHLLSLVSKFPSGIRGIDLRFALRMQKSDFVQLAKPSLINKTISLNDNDLSDFEEGKFKLSAICILRKQNKLQFQRLSAICTKRYRNVLKV